MTAPRSADPVLLEALRGIVPSDRIATDAPLAPLTTFRIGGPADVLVTARTADELVSVMECVRSTGVEPVLLGSGANVLIADAGIRGVVVRCDVQGIEWLDEVTVRAGAGVRTYHELIDVTVARGLGGLHHYVGIPSTVGGALWQNLHFLSPDRSRTCFIEEVVAGAEIWTEEGERRSVDREYFEFGYDESILHRRADVVLSADFRLTPAPIDELRAVIRENLAWRDERHPDLWLYPCAGSIFKKIEGIGAGRLIDQCGLKGRVHGAAQIFHRHANIIVNLGGATAAEVRWLMDLARDTVERETGHVLEPEIDLLGEF
jgi:UDP-N-acetylmuramate dehydrogenase